MTSKTIKEFLLSISQIYFIFYSFKEIVTLHIIKQKHNMKFSTHKNVLNLVINCNVTLVEYVFSQVLKSFHMK